MTAQSKPDDAAASDRAGAATDPVRAPGPAADRRLPGRLGVRVCYLIARGLGLVYWHLTSDGRGNVPKAGPVILAANHSGLVDAVLAQSGPRRPAHFLMKQELARGLFGRILLALGQVPVDRSDGHAALESCLELLRQGRAVGIFPEGNRGVGRVDSIRAGVAWLAVHSGAPVIPVACLGTRRDGEKVGLIPPPRRHLHVSIGPAMTLDFPDQADTHERIGLAIDQIRLQLAAWVAGAEQSSGVRLPTSPAPKRGPERQK